MATIRFKPDSSVNGNECGVFEVARTACLDYLGKQVELFALAGDVQLLNWVVSAKPQAAIPDSLGERARFMIAELIEDEVTVDVYCSHCGTKYSKSSLRKQNWDETHEERGIRVGTVGHQLECPNGHCLIAICDRIY